MPARLRDIVRALTALGVTVEPPRGGGSHWKATNAAGRVFMLAAHNGEHAMIADVYIHKLCRRLDLDLQDLKHRL